MTDDPEKTTDQPDADEKNGVEKALDNLADSFDRLGKHADPAKKDSALNNFFRAVKANRLDDVRKTLEAGIDPNAYNALGQTPLHVAAIAGAVETARLLIEYGADPRRGKENDPARTPLEDAVNFNKHEMVELLAQHGGYTPGGVIDGWSLLHRACDKGKHLTVEALLKAGANCNEMTGNGSTPLLIAITRGHVELVKTLLKFPAVIETMNEYFVATDEKKRTAFQLAIDSGKVQLIASMIEGGANVNGADAAGKTPLLCAIENSNLELVRLLVANGADLNVSAGAYGTPLVHACMVGGIDDMTRAEMLDLLISLGADMDIPAPESGMTPLHLVISEVWGEEVLAVLLRYPMNKEARDATGATPLLLAAAIPSRSFVRQLLKAGADPNGRHGEDARTPLIQAVACNSSICIKALLEAGANPVLYDGHGKSALSYVREGMPHARAAWPTDFIAEMAAMLENALRERAAAKKSPPSFP